MMGDVYLVAGGGGNLACQLTFELAERGHRVVLFDRTEHAAARIAEGCEYIRGDVTESEQLASIVCRYRPKVFLHFASLLSGSSETDRAQAWRVNVDAAFSLLETVLTLGVKQFFFPSSLAVYGNALPSLLPEDYPEWPSGLYGVTKLAVERLGHYYHKRHGLDFRCLRVPVVLSPYAPPGAASAYASRAFVEAVRQERFTFKVRPDTRPACVYVKDALNAIVRLVEAPAERLTRRVYNIQGLSPSAGELAAAISARIPRARIEFDPDPQLVSLVEGWPREIADASARSDWSWQPQYDLDALDALADDFIGGLRHESAATPEL
jgi:threonine 3-dehydrogenase